MTRAAWVLALFPLLMGAPSACSKFAESATETSDAGDVPDTATAETGSAPVEHRIYVFGGVTAQPGLVSVTKAYVSTVAANGDIGPWTPAPELDDNRHAHGDEAVDDVRPPTTASASSCRLLPRRPASR